MRRFLALLALLASGVAHAQAVVGTPQMDWCSPIVVRPDERWDSSLSCSGRRRSWTDAEVARHASVVYLLGGVGNAFAVGTDEPQAETGATCLGGGAFGVLGFPTREWYLEYVRRIVALRPAGMAPIKWVVAHRWDLVTSKQLGSRLDSFDPAWFWRTDPADATPRTTLEAFWNADDSTPCGGASTNCYWDDRQLQYGVAELPGGAPACGTDATKRCMRELVNLAAGEDAASGTAHEDAIYYVELQRDSASQSRGWATGVVGRQDLAGYRAWHLVLAEEAVDYIETAAGVGNVWVDLNHKFHFWFNKASCAGGGCSTSTSGVPASSATPDETQFLGSEFCETVAEREDVECEWSGKPDFSTLSYSAYVQAVYDTAQAIEAAGLKYAYLSDALSWCGNTPTCTTVNNYFDETATGGVNEAELRRDIASECDDCIVLLGMDYGSANWPMLSAVTTQIEAGAGTPTIIPYAASPTYCPGRVSAGYMPQGFGKQRGVTLR